ncbi:MAG: M20/M25/M40 family metallo-hydrolase [Planctomycetes bacterium]|nr:M20/M25/M40 family metallo-hydrolase [Planctomycetota bacterium]
MPRHAAASRFALLAALPTLAFAQEGDPIRADELEAHVRLLADDRLAGRMTGERGCEEAAAYLVERFTALGLEPGGDQGTDGRSFLQHFVAISGRELLPTTALTLAGVPLALGKEFTAAFGSGQASGSGELLFAGFGLVAPELQRDDYAGLDAAGKVVVVWSGAPGRARGEGDFLDTKPGGNAVKLRAKIQAAFARKAAAIVVVQTAGEEKERAELLPPWRSDRGEGLTFAAAQVTASAGRALFAALGLDAAKLLAEAEAGGTVGRALPGSSGALTVAMKSIERPTANVIGVLPGSGGHGSQHLVIGAHYDHLGMGGSDSLSGETAIHNGADDNASGTAALLEIAELLATGPRPQRTIVFAGWSGEELGLLGSKHWTEQPLLPLAACFANLNLDMVGRSRDNYCAVGAVGSSPAFRDFATQANAALDLKLKLDLVDGGMAQGSSDHQSFLNAQVPALFFFSGLHEDYHKPSDDAEKVNCEGAARIATLCAAVARAIDGLPERPPFVAPAPVNPHAGVAGGPPRSGGGNRPWFGSIPSFGAAVDGVVFDGVSKGSPAEKAGLQKGDKLIEWNGREVKTLEDFTALLATAKVGDTVKIVLLRDGKKVDAEVTLAVRPQS